MEYTFHILVLVGIYTTLAVSLDLLVGHTGLLSVAQAAFFGVGAYASALLEVHFGVPFLIAVASSMALAVLVAIVVASPSLRLQDDFFIIATLGFQMILFTVFNNWTNLTRGPLGIPGIPRPVIFGWTVQSHVEFVFLAFVIAASAYLVVGILSTGPFGRVLHAIREDEIFTESVGKHALKFKLTAFAVSAALAACAGSLYAHYMTYIDPTSFTVMESILVVSMIIIGGAGSRWGPLVGAVVLVTLPEALRFVGFPSSVAANLRQIIYGALLVIIIMFRPRGLMGKYGFGR